jgi:hypothetical protein
MPTNNTEAVPSGHSRRDDPDATYDALASPRYTISADWDTKRDGQWLAEMLGLAPDFFAHTVGADGTDQQAGRAMNRLLWPATLGYWMTTMMRPVFDADVIAATRDFFTRHVLGAGSVPAIRVGNQPYGILPATVFSQMSWLDQPVRDGVGVLAAGAARGAYLRALYAVLDRTRREWAPLAAGVSHVGGPGDPHQVLLDVVGLHPGSVEWGQRTAESLETVVNRLNLQGLAGFFELLVRSLERQAARDLLSRNGYSGDAVPKLLDQVYDGDLRRLSGGVVDDRPLSPTAPIRAYTADGHNYLYWLSGAARAGIEAVYAQAGFIDDTPPAALLYLLARHALQLGYHDTAIRLHVAAGLYQPAQVAAAYAESSFLHVVEAPVSESRYLPLLSAQPAITGSPTQTVSRYIATQLGILVPAGDLTEQIAAIDLLRDEPTARLEQAFADHIDCCSYRLDAWLLGLVHHQLSLMRGLYGQPEHRPDAAADKAPGRSERGLAGEERLGRLHLGAYAWVENLRPKPIRGAPVVLDDPALARAFAGRGPLISDPTNFGYIHAPSLNHAVAAAVLRNGYERGEGGGALAVNLTPARVRVALAMLEGIRAGQSLSDLLGYQFERGLHDLGGGIEADRYIFPLRQAFPLRANRLASTAVEGVPIETIEARNVLDGLALVEQIVSSGQSAYPFGRPDLPAAITTADRDALTAQAARLLETQDAVADLALAEGVYQAVMGNYDRVAATYDAYAHGAFPPEPDVIRTPLSGLGLTQRVALHLDPTASPTTSPVPTVPMTPRAQGEPAVNAWLAGVLPPLDQVASIVDFTEASTGTATAREVRLDQLGLQPIDLMAIVRDDTDVAMSEVDDRIVGYAHANFGVSPAVRPQIRYAATVTAPCSVFEAMPLLRAARTLLTLSRPLSATDLALAADARSTSDATVDLDHARVDGVRTALQGLHDDLNAYAGQLDALVTGQPARRDELLTGIDMLVDQLAGLLARAAQFGLPQSGWGFAYAARDRGFVALGTAVAELVTRWQGRVAEYNDRQAAVAGLDPGAPDAERMRLLTQAERAITADPIMPRPLTPGDFQAALASRLTTFTSRLAGFSDLVTTTATGAAQLRTAIRTLLPIDTLDSTAATFTGALAAAEDGLVQLAADALAVVNAVAAAAQRRLAAAGDALAQAGTATDARGRLAARQAAAKALLGDGFVVVPTFRLDSATAAVMGDAYAASQSAAPFSHLTAPPAGQEPVQFPVDTWLHGAARVRPKLSAWERLQLFTEALGQPAPDLAALQLPYVAGEPWLGLQFPADHQITDDRLLYTAHFAGGAPSTAGPLCGLLLDEWSEVIPGDRANTGLAFHFDRPNSEAPQSMLLVTPPQFRGAWRFDDLVAALNETLDLAKLRAVEPAQIAQTPYAPLLPATVSATQSRQLTIAADLALNNALRFLA